MTEGDGGGEPAGDALPLSVADIDLTTMTTDESVAWKKMRWVWCGKCGGGSINKVGWGHKKVHGDSVMSLKAAGKLEEAQREFLFIQRGGKALDVMSNRLLCIPNFINRMEWHAR